MCEHTGLQRVASSELIDPLQQEGCDITPDNLVVIGLFQRLLSGSLYRRRVSSLSLRHWHTDDNPVGQTQLLACIYNYYY